MPMNLGWTHVSDRDVRAAASSLKGGGQGVVDEVGVRVLHSLYADRFFPGTSVQQTRLRYIYFVPWLLQRAWEDRLRRGQVLSALEASETQVCQSLIAGDGAAKGIVGVSQPGEPVAQPPRATYWGLLCLLGTIPQHPRSERSQSLSELIQTWPDRRARVVDDDEGTRIAGGALAVDAGVPMPTDFPNGLLKMALTDREKKVAKSRLQSIRQFGASAGPRSLLAGLAESDAWPGARALLAPEAADLRREAGARGTEDAAALDRAARAAALGSVVRAIYAALLEAECEADRRAVGREHRDALAQATDEHGGFASALDLDAVRNDAPAWHGSHRALRSGSPVRAVLDETVAWLSGGAGPVPSSLRRSYVHAEFRRKLQRARLSVGAVALRQVWDPDKHGWPAPLHFRVDVVDQFLVDLHGSLGK